MKLLMVFLGGGIGASLRYGTGRLVPVLTNNHNPIWSTMAANVLASILFAVFAVYVLPKSSQQNMNLLLLTGICGGYSTFSTFAFENLTLMQRGQWGFFLLNISLSLALSIGVMAIIIKKSDLI
jgi:CrcB protein